MSLKRALKISLFTSALALGTILIPPFSMGGINITLQTFFVMLCGLMLVPIDAFMAVFLYLLLGLIGLPVFSGYSSGLATFISPAGGFLLAFPFSSYLISKTIKSNYFHNFLVLVGFGVILVYLAGAIGISLYLELPYFAALLSLLIFIPFDILKIILALILAKRLKKTGLMA